MKILVLTSKGKSDKKIHIVIDRITVYYEEDEGEGSVVRLLNGEWYYVKETPEFITNQLVDADVSPYVVYNSEEHK